MTTGCQASQVFFAMTSHWSKKPPLVPSAGRNARVHPKVPREFTVALECLAARRALIDAAPILDLFRTVCDHLPLLFACTCAGSIEIVALLQTFAPNSFACISPGMLLLPQDAQAAVVAGPYAVRQGCKSFSVRRWSDGDVLRSKSLYGDHFSASRLLLFRV